VGSEGSEQSRAKKIRRKHGTFIYNANSGAAKPNVAGSSIAFTEKQKALLHLDQYNGTR